MDSQHQVSSCFHIGVAGYLTPHLQGIAGETVLAAAFLIYRNRRLVSLFVSKKSLTFSCAGFEQALCPTKSRISRRELLVEKLRTYGHGTSQNYGRTGSTYHLWQDWQNLGLACSPKLYSVCSRARQGRDMRSRLRCTQSIRNGSGGCCTPCLRQSAVGLPEVKARTSIICTSVVPTSTRHGAFPSGVVHKWVLLVILNKDVKCSF